VLDKQNLLLRDLAQVIYNLHYIAGSLYCTFDFEYLVGH
jgi:hypothetical protein